LCCEKIETVRSRFSCVSSSSYCARKPSAPRHGFPGYDPQAAPGLYDAFQPVLSVSEPVLEADLLKVVYKQISASDFAKDVLAVSTEKLAVVNTGDIGWSALEDPEHLITALCQNGIKNP
jgi:hypothetical protein